MNTYLKSQGVDNKGMKLFNSAWDNIGYRERQAEIEAAWRECIKNALIEGATWAGGDLVLKIGGKLVKVGYKAYKLSKLRKGEKRAEYLYHYTSEAAVNAIKEQGLKMGKTDFRISLITELSRLYKLRLN